MQLFIGAFGQNKLENVRLKLNLTDCKFADGANCSENEFEEALIVNHVHLYIRNHLQQLKTDEGQACFFRCLSEQENKILIGDEIGCGIIPLDSFEREYREIYGRMMCRIAQNAKRVTRLVCGVHQVIKE